MKFIKGLLIGGVIGTGTYIMYSKNGCETRKKLIKNGKKFIKNMGII